MASCTIREADTGARHELLFEARCAGQRVGRIQVHRARKKIRGLTVWTVDDVFVDKSARRRRIATRLYEAAAQAVCDRRGHLASVDRILEGSSAFWAKQERKGRARRVARKGQMDTFILDCAHAGDLSEAQEPWRASAPLSQATPWVVAGVALGLLVIARVGRAPPDRGVLGAKA